MAPKSSQLAPFPGKTASARRSHNISLKTHAKEAINIIVEQSKDNPNKIFPALAHIIDMDGDMTIQSAQQANLQDLFDEEPRPNTYHVWKKVPEYFWVAWMRTKLRWWSLEISAMARHHDSGIVRKIVEALTGLSEKTRVPVDCLNKVVCARFLDFLYLGLGSRSQLIQDAMNDDAKFDWEGKGIWSVMRKSAEVLDTDDSHVIDGTWLALTSNTTQTIRVYLPKRLQMDSTATMINNWSDLHAKISVKVGGFTAMGLACCSKDLEAYLEFFDPTCLKNQAKRLEQDMQREIFLAKTGAVRADEEMAAASSAKRRKTLVEEVQAGKRHIVKRPFPALPSGPVAPLTAA
mmetsp:Transcript_21508/g.67174  ORF Transcript_21508/g.67174 Transcript_21508/m.67174 type:complete len:348 (-) Transcript_21508:174-1217(-)